MMIPGDINSLEINEDFLNEPPQSPAAPCYGVTLADLRKRLRAMLSSYAPNTLLPNDPSNDLELQYINDGISLLWPHDYRVDFKSYPIVEGQTRYYLPMECEFVFGVYVSQEDLYSQQGKTYSVPHYDGWLYDNSYVDAAPVTIPGKQEVWQDAMKKAVQIVDPYAIGADRNYRRSSSRYLSIRYAQRWPNLVNEQDCINPSGNRIQAIIFYACHEYITSQFEVNSESIRYQNYMGIANRFFQQYMMMLVKDSKPLYYS